MSRSLRAVLALFAVLALALGVAASAPAQTPATPTLGDSAFIIAATQSNLFEIQTGQIAESRGSSRDVRAIGRLLVADNTKQLQVGASAAQALVLPTLPTLPNGVQQEVVKQLNKLRGPRFDRAFLQAQVTAHNGAIAVYTGEATYTTSPTLRVLAVNALPVLGAHLGMVQGLIG